MDNPLIYSRFVNENKFSSQLFFIARRSCFPNRSFDHRLTTS